jgi:hypothetical protein
MFVHNGSEYSGAVVTVLQPFDFTQSLLQCSFTDVSRGFHNFSTKHWRCAFKQATTTSLKTLT